MSEYRVAKLEALLARVLERKDQPRVVAVAAAPAASVAPAVAPAASAPPPSLHHAATTPPPPPVAVPAVSIPRQPLPTEDFQESTHVSQRASGPELVPNAAESHARIATAGRVEEPSFPSEADEPAPVSSERTVDPSLEADVEAPEAPPESTRQLATSPPSAQARPSARPSVVPDSAPRSVQNPVITRGSLPPDANAAVEFEGEVAKPVTRTVADLLDATFSL